MKLFSRRPLVVFGAVLLLALLACALGPLKREDLLQLGVRRTRH